MFGFANDIYVITSYFNPEGYNSKRKNFETFASKLENSNIPWLAIETSFGNSNFDLPKSKNIFRIQGKDIMWQKERILNICIDKLPFSCKKFAWLDCDIIFENEKWLQEASIELEKHAVVQPFEKVIRLPRGCREYVETDEQWKSFASVLKSEPNQLLFGDFATHGHTGFAWASHKSIFKKYGLYDGCIAGSGDHMMAHAFSGDWHSSCIRRILGENRSHIQHFRNWSEKVYSKIHSKVSYIPGKILHLWHGRTENRRYVLRNRELAEMKFNPSIDIRIGKSGLWEWSNNNALLKEWAIKYFKSRKEDEEAE